MRRTTIQIPVVFSGVLGPLLLFVTHVGYAQELTPLPPGQVGVAYFVDIKAQGGLPPLAWQLASGDLPPGLKLSHEGQVTGTPAVARPAAYAFELKVSDSSQPEQTASMQFSLVVNAARLQITGDSTHPPALKIVRATVENEAADPPTSSTSNNAATAHSGETQERPSAEGISQNSADTIGVTPVESSQGAPQTRTCESTSTPYFPEPIVLGRKVLSGCAGRAPGARVMIYAKGAIDLCPAPVPVPSPSGLLADLTANVNPKTGIFQIELRKPVAEGMLICSYSLDADQNPPAIVTKWGYDEAETPLGRTRYYVSTGVELSQVNQQFSNQDLYLGLGLDRNWLRGKPNSAGTMLFNSEFSAQLTSIPAAASSTTTTSSGATTQSVGTFISSRKAGVVSGALYAPIYFNAFKGWFGGGTSAFFAPILKGGLQSITTGTLSASAPVPGTTTTSATVNNAGLYYFWGAGLRLGDLRLYRSWNIAPQILSHLDLTVGQWENFKQCRTVTNCSPMNGIIPPSQLYQPFLFSLEGALDIPKTPVQIGFKSVTPLNGGGQGDLRFFFGVKLDVGCIYKAFKGGSTPKFLDCTDDQATTSATATSTTSGKGGAAAPAAPANKP